MIIHIGNNNYIYEKDIIAILDKKAADGTKKTREFISKLIEDNRLVGDINSKTKSYIIIIEDKKDAIVYTSNISSKTLLNRNIY